MAGPVLFRRHDDGFGTKTVFDRAGYEVQLRDWPDAEDPAGFITAAKPQGGLPVDGGMHVFPFVGGEGGRGSGSRTHLYEFMRLTSVRWSSFPLSIYKYGKPSRCRPGGTGIWRPGRASWRPACRKWSVKNGNPALRWQKGRK